MRQNFRAGMSCESGKPVLYFHNYGKPEVNFGVLTLHNTLSGKEETFSPLEDDKVKMYCCGPTVYDYFHIGNARPFIIFDGLRRYLRYRGYEVQYVQNVTDVDDKIINRATEQGVEPSEIASKYSRAYFEDLERLGVTPADENPRVTDYIQPIIEYVRELVNEGYAYSVNGNVYYRVKKFEGYGKLSGRSLDQLDSGSRVNINDQKEDPLDFALWKESEGEEIGWESPWGKGRPGWHIECSVMANEVLGQEIDIHAGGQDLIFPHHENEIAQSEAKSGKRFARYWLHNGLLKFEGRKMSKSLENFRYARDVVKEYGTEAVRLFYYSTHYRKPLDFSIDHLEDSRRAVDKVYNTLEEIEQLDLSFSGEAKGQLDKKEKKFAQFLDGVEDRFIEKMDRDFNTPGGIGVIFELVKETNKFRNQQSSSPPRLLERAREMIRGLGQPLGLFQRSLGGERKCVEDDLLDFLVEIREELRRRENWDLADKIRARLREMGVELKDSSQGTVWTVKRD